MGSRIERRLIDVLRAMKVLNGKCGHKPNIRECWKVKIARCRWGSVRLTSHGSTYLCDGGSRMISTILLEQEGIILSPTMKMTDNWGSCARKYVLGVLLLYFVYFGVGKFNTRVN